MPMYLDTRGRSTLGIGVCGRCGIKMSLDDLYADPNYPGLRVCSDDRDNLDPWRLPARPDDRTVLDYPRPDVPLAVGPEYYFTTQVIQIAPGGQVTVTKPSVPWTASTPYALGAQVTVSNPVGFNAAGNIFYVFTCTNPGTSGASAPAWSTRQGTIVTDNTVTWINAGLYLP